MRRYGYPNNESLALAMNDSTNHNPRKIDRLKGETNMATYEERRDKRFHEATIATLNDIQNRLGTIEPSDDLVQSSLRYAAAYSILRGYIESLLVNFAESFSEDQLAEIRIVLDQLRTLVREDEHVDEATGEKLDQLAEALRES
jgi:hypothetical protein